MLNCLAWSAGHMQVESYNICTQEKSSFVLYAQSRSYIPNQAFFEAICLTHNRITKKFLLILNASIKLYIELQWHLDHYCDYWLYHYVANRTRPPMPPPHHYSSLRSLLHRRPHPSVRPPAIPPRTSQFCHLSLRARFIFTPSCRSYVTIYKP